MPPISVATDNRHLCARRSQALSQRAAQHTGGPNYNSHFAGEVKKFHKGMSLWKRQSAEKPKVIQTPAGRPLKILNCELPDGRDSDLAPPSRFASPQPFP